MVPGRLGRREAVTDIDRIDQAALSAALDALAENPADPSFNEIGRLATNELLRRLREDAYSLPGTDLMKLVTAYFKAKAAGEADDTPPEPDPDVLTLVSSPGLPGSRKRELLLSERAKIVERLSALDTAREELDG